jgi:hypothetical protein
LRISCHRGPSRSQFIRRLLLQRRGPLQTLPNPGRIILLGLTFQLRWLHRGLGRLLDKGKTRQAQIDAPITFCFMHVRRLSSSSPGCSGPSEGRGDVILCSGRCFRLFGRCGAGLYLRGGSSITIVYSSCSVRHSRRQDRGGTGCRGRVGASGRVSRHPSIRTSRRASTMGAG